MCRNDEATKRLIRLMNARLSLVSWTLALKLRQFAGTTMTAQKRYTILSKIAEALRDTDIQRVA